MLHWYSYDRPNANECLVMQGVRISAAVYPGICEYFGFSTEGFKLGNTLWCLLSKWVAVRLECQASGSTSGHKMACDIQTSAQAIICNAAWDLVEWRDVLYVSVVLPFACKGCPYGIRLHLMFLTHWGRVMHICIGKLTTIASDNGLSPGRRQAIIWTDAGILSIGSLGTNFNEILSEIHKFSFKKMYFKISSAKWRPFCLGLNVLTHWPLGDVSPCGLGDPSV